jgi:hypothetical protein
MQHGTGPNEPSALTHGIGELSLRSSAVAIVVPLCVVAALYATGHRLDGSTAGLRGQPLLAGLVGSFVLIPMFAATGATTAVLVGVATFAGRLPPTRRRTVEALFILAVGSWAVLAAIAYDAVIVPAIA